MPKKITTLYIDDNSIKLVVTQGKQIRQWSESALEPGLIDNNLILDEAEVGARITRLFQEQNIKNKRVMLGISGIRCLSRPVTFPKLPKEMLDEAVRREAERLLPVPLNELYLSWQQISAPAEQTRAFMVGIPRQIADTLFKVLQKAGIRVDYMEIKPVLVARVVDETSAIIVDVQTLDFDIIVLSNGALHPIRTVRFPEDTNSYEEKLATIKNELNRSLNFYSMTYPEIPLDSSVKIFISGDLTDDVSFRDSLSADTGYSVSELPSPLEITEGFQSAHFMANIGLAFHAMSDKEKPESNVITLNALPIVYQTKTVSLAHVLPLPAGAALIALLAFILLFNQSISTSIVNLNADIDRTNKAIQQKQTQRQQLTTTVNALEKQLGQATTLRDNFKNILDTIEQKTETMSLNLNSSLDGLPAETSIIEINEIDNTLTIYGQSSKESRILSYISNLDNSNLYGNIWVTDITRNSNVELSFVISGKVDGDRNATKSTKAALSNLPASVKVTKMTSDNKTFLIDGTTYSADRLFTYIRGLESSEKFNEITLTRMTEDIDDQINFSLLLKAGE